MEELGNQDLKILELEEQEASKLLLQVEATMHDVTKFYTTLLLSLMTVSIALVSLGAGTSATSTSKAYSPIKLEWFGILWLGFVTVGFLELHYFMELRIRKIKMVDRIVAIRELFSDIASDRVKVLLQDKLLFITGIRQSPPFLRRPSGEWYLILYVCALNATALVFSIWALALFADWSAWIAVWAGAVAFVFQYWSITARAYHEDLRRAQNYGPSNYSYLSHGEVALVFRPFNFLARCSERYLSWRKTP